MSEHPHPHSTAPSAIEAQPLAVEVVASAVTTAAAGTSSGSQRTPVRDGDRETTEVGMCVGCGSSPRGDPMEAIPLPATGISSIIGTEPRATTEAGIGMVHYGCPSAKPHLS